MSASGRLFALSFESFGEVLVLIARLIADPADLETRISDMQRGLGAKKPGLLANLSLDRAQVINHGLGVVELHFSHDDPQIVFSAIEKHFGRCDALVSRREIMVPQLFVSDMDSTMIGQECIDELADYAGLKPEIAAITERAMQGELDFESALLERVRLLEGLAENAIEACLRERIHPTSGAKVLTQTLKAKGCRTVLVTGGFHHFADRVAEWLGFERVVGNRLQVRGGRLTGALDGAITDASTKESVLREEAAGIGPDAKTLATGDGANDIPMLQTADYGFAYCAKPKAKAAANGRIDGPDLRAILTLLGVPQNEWTEDIV